MNFLLPCSPNNKARTGNSTKSNRNHRRVCRSIEVHPPIEVPHGGCSLLSPKTKDRLIVPLSRDRLPASFVATHFFAVFPPCPRLLSRRTPIVVSGQDYSFKVTAGTAHEPQSVFAFHRRRRLQEAPDICAQNRWLYDSSANILRKKKASWT